MIAGIVAAIMLIMGQVTKDANTLLLGIGWALLFIGEMIRDARKRN